MKPEAQNPSPCATQKPDPISELEHIQESGVSLRKEERLVGAEELLELLFDDGSRPSIHWLRDQQKARNIPYVKMGRLVFFKPSEVRKFIEQRLTVKARSK